MGAHEHVDGVDLHDPDVVEDLAEVPSVDSPARTRPTEALRRERDPSRLRDAELVELPHGQVRIGSGRTKLEWLPSLFKDI